MRLDGNVYESTMDALSALYPKRVGGCYLIDHYTLTVVHDRLLVKTEGRTVLSSSSSRSTGREHSGGVKERPWNKGIR
jgi:hypothetical protein